MAWFECTCGSGGGGTTSKTIYLTENLKIGVAMNTVTATPYDTNNYVTVSDNVVTFKRNNSNYSLWLPCPIELEVGKIYSFAYDSKTNTDGYLYLDKAPNGIPETGSFTVNRIFQIAPPASANRGMVFIVSTTGYYGFPIWSNNTNDIVVNNPSITEIS